MDPADFPESNRRYGPPDTLEESQVRTVPVWEGVVARGSCEGLRLVVTCWKPTPNELAQIVAGSPVFLSSLGGLMPHFLTTNFQEATNPA